MTLQPILSAEAVDELRRLVDGATHVVMFCHQNADGDAIGSMAAATLLLRRLGKTVTAVAPNNFPDFLLWIPTASEVVQADRMMNRVDEALAEADLVLMLDFNTPKRMGDELAGRVLACEVPKVMIDHHLDPTVDAAICISHPEASSTCELVFRLVWQLGLFDQLTKHFAVPVYCGMMTDTGGFTYNSCDPDIFFIISQLLTKHINKDKIYRNVYHNFSENRLRLTGFVMYQRLVVDPQRHASYFTITRDDMRRFHFVKGDAEGLVNMPLQIKGHKLSISLREDTEKDNLIWVSLRSVDQFPCNEMAARFFNGGGHLNASGGRLYCSLAEAVKVTQQAILAFEAQLK